MNCILTFANLHSTWIISFTLWLVYLGVGHFEDFCWKNIPSLVFILKLWIDVYSIQQVNNTINIAVTWSTSMSGNAWYVPQTHKGIEMGQNKLFKSQDSQIQTRLFSCLTTIRTSAGVHISGSNLTKPTFSMVLVPPKQCKQLLQEHVQYFGPVTKQRRTTCKCTRRLPVFPLYGSSEWRWLKGL